MACALTPSGRRLVVEDSPEAVSRFLRPHPVRQLQRSDAYAARWYVLGTDGRQTTKQASSQGGGH
ncbi:hypothetical protein ACFYRN_43130 [Streptomyces sp. NPDC005227]|uniref:hypothetical protein n=1 Tax=Streptomyces sp. NPDC005227 TaxID=3364707 RepID=UPI003683A445